MTLDEVKKYIKTHEIHESVRYFLFRELIPAIDSRDDYNRLKSLVKIDHPRAEEVLIGGSGNWGFSFNPKNFLRPFCEESDIDLVVISKHDFQYSWEVLRDYHRNNWYLIGKANQIALRRSGENVYSGFITPKWINDTRNPKRIEYEEMVNSYSNGIVKYKPVNMMYFKNEVELIDYYIRSFRLVRES